MAASVMLDGTNLSIETLVRISRDPSVRVERAPKTDSVVRRSEASIAKIVDKYKKDYAAFDSRKTATSPATEYGVTTGFGEFKDQPIHPRDLEALQRNLLLSHSVGVGLNTDRDDRSNYFPAEVVRAALATRLNAFLKGHSGVRLRLVEIVQAMLNRGVIPLVPLRGSVGASGDLCPLSHLFVTLLGENSFYLLSAPERICKGVPALLKVLRRELPDLKKEEMAPTFKEGLALTNGANFSTAMLALAVYDAQRLADAADTAAAFTLEVLGGCTRALDEKVHLARGQQGQIESAARMRSMLEGSHQAERAGAVQDPYSIRCAPQVHGASRDAIAYARNVVSAEINAATDNPLFFSSPGDTPWDVRFAENWPDWYDGKARAAYSAGNFHGQPIALAADFLGIAVAELANISERRSQMMLDAHHNRGLPANLTTSPGVNSGLMIAQYTAASLVSENKVLAHPASVDSIPTSANSEDHVSMSTHAARKLRTILGNAQTVIAIEMLTAAQAADWRIGMNLSPAAPRPDDDGKLPQQTIETVADANKKAAKFKQVTAGWRKSVLPKLAPKLRPVYRSIRECVPAIVKDQTLDEPVRALRVLIESGSLVGD
jgi:histidine ammonia-lyase